MLTPQPDCDDRIVPIEKGPFIGFRCPFTDNVWVYTDEREFVYLPAALLKTADGAGASPVVVKDVLDQLEFPADVAPMINAITTSPSDPTLLALWCEIQSSEEADFDESFLYVVRLSYAAEKKDAGSVNFSVVAKTKISPSAQSISWSPSGKEIAVECRGHKVGQDAEKQQEKGKVSEGREEEEAEVEIFQLKHKRGSTKLESFFSYPRQHHAAYVTAAVPKFFPATANKASAPPAAAASFSQTSNVDSWIVTVNAETERMELWKGQDIKPASILSWKKFIAPDRAEEGLKEGQSMFDDIPVEAMAGVGRYFFVLDKRWCLHLLSMKEGELASMKFKIPLLAESEEAELSEGAPRVFVTLLEPTKEQPQPLVAVASNCSPVIRIFKLSWEGSRSVAVVDSMVLEKGLAPLGLITLNDGTLLVLTKDVQRTHDSNGVENDVPLDLKFIPVSVNLKAPGRLNSASKPATASSDKEEKEKVSAAIPHPKGGFFGGNQPAPFQNAFESSLEPGGHQLPLDQIAASVGPTKVQVIVKTPVGESHEIDLDAIGTGEAFNALRMVIEKDLGVPIFRQRLLVDDGKVSLRNAAQLDCMLLMLQAGTRLSIQLAAKRDFFLRCNQHQDYEGRTLCVPCGKVLCQKCLISHINGAKDSPNHALADLEDASQFASAMKSVLQRSDSCLTKQLRKEQLSVETFARALFQLFEGFQTRRFAHSTAMLSSSHAALAKLARLSLRTTLDVAVWIAAQQSVDLSESPQNDQRKDTGCDGVSLSGGRNTREEQQLRLTAPAETAFQQCIVHSNQVETAFCVQCNKMMCPKCFGRHGNRVQGHQFADMEEAAQFIEVVQPHIDLIDEQIDKNYEGLQRQEQVLYQDLRMSFDELWSAWAAVILALKRQFRAEVSLARRELATTPLELLQWLQSTSFYRGRFSLSQ